MTDEKEETKLKDFMDRVDNHILLSHNMLAEQISDIRQDIYSSAFLLIVLIGVASLVFAHVADKLLEK